MSYDEGSFCAVALPLGVMGITCRPQASVKWVSVLVVTALLLGADSLLVGAAVAPTMRARSHRLLLATLCGLADAAALAVGLSLAALRPPPASMLVTTAPAVVLAGYGLYLMTVSAILPASPRALLVVLPLALSLDNLLYPARDGALAGGSMLATGIQILSLGASSGAVMLLGLEVGHRVEVKISARRQRRWVGLGLVATALLAVVA